MADNIPEQKPQRKSSLFERLKRSFESLKASEPEKKQPEVQTVTPKKIEKQESRENVLGKIGKSSQDLSNVNIQTTAKEDKIGKIDQKMAEKSEAIKDANARKQGFKTILELQSLPGARDGLKRWSKKAEKLENDKSELNKSKESLSAAAKPAPEKASSESTKHREDKSKIRKNVLGRLGKSTEDLSNADISKTARADAKIKRASKKIASYAKEKEAAQKLADKWKKVSIKEQNQPGFHNPYYLEKAQKQEKKFSEQVQKQETKIDKLNKSMESIVAKEEKNKRAIDGKPKLRQSKGTKDLKKVNIFEGMQQNSLVNGPTNQTKETTAKSKSTKVKDYRQQDDINKFEKTLKKLQKQSRSLIEKMRNNAGVDSGRKGAPPSPTSEQKMQQNKSQER